MASPHDLKLKRHAKAGTLEDARLLLWRAMRAAEEAMYRSAEYGDTGGVLRGVHAISQAAGSYAKLVEVSELEGRLAELEKAMEARTDGHAGGYARNGRGAYA